MNGAFNRPVPLNRQAEFTLVNVFHECTEYVRNYTLPFNMLTIHLRAEGDDASVVENLRTGKVYRARMNDITLIPAGLPQQYRHTLRSERYSIHFRLELYPGIDVFSEGSSRIVENSPELRAEAEEIFREPNRVLMLSRCREFALRFCHRYWPEREPVRAERARFFEPVLRQVRRSLSAELQVADMAEIAGCSRGYFVREFQAVFGQSPKEYLQHELYRRASVLLLAPGASVKSVADELRFSTEFNFSRFFKRLSGLSPNAYRKDFPTS